MNFNTFMTTAPAIICARPADMTARINTGVCGKAPIAAEYIFGGSMAPPTLRAVPDDLTILTLVEVLVGRHTTVGHDRGSV
jgi:hypothetical protein